MIGEFRQLAGELASLGCLCFFDARQVRQLDLKLVGLASQLRQHSSKGHRGSYRFDGVFRPNKDGGRRPVSDALQCRQYLGNQRAPAIQRPANAGFAAIELSQINLRGRNPFLIGANPRSSIDQRLIELAAIVGDHIVFGRKPLLGFRRFALFGPDRIKFLIVLFDRVERGRVRGRRD